MYAILKRILFCFDAEKIHHFSMNLFSALCKIRPARKLIQQLYGFNSAHLSKTVAGITFSNPLGLAAGFDKNALYLHVFQTLGFGFMEIGTVTPLPQEGNEKPRLFRLVKDKAIINRMGFNNHGVETVAARVSNYRKLFPLSKKYPMVIGGNIGKNKNTPNEDAWADYDKCFDVLHPHVDYFVVNVSSPNTPGLRELQEVESLRKILMHLQELNFQKPITRPIFLKISPDISEKWLEDIIQLAIQIRLDGLVVANTTLSRNQLKTRSKKIADIGYGGLSGRPLTNISQELTEKVSSISEGKLAIISSGGIFTSEDANQRISVGADLIQIWTGFIFEGPRIIRKILKKLNY